MSKYANVWLGLSQQGLDAFKERRQDERDDVVYTGNMDDTTYAILSKMADLDVVQRMFPTYTAQGKTYHLFSLYLVGSQKVGDALDHLEAEWPGHFVVAGVWWTDGRQVGTQFVYEDIVDEYDNVIGQEVVGITGTPLYPVHSKTYKFMPDIVTYDEAGDEVSRIVAQSNADLRDINLWSGQTPRLFV